MFEFICVLWKKYINHCWQCGCKMRIKWAIVKMFVICLHVYKNAANKAKNAYGVSCLFIQYGFTHPDDDNVRWFFHMVASLKIVVFLHSTVLAGLKLILCIFICHISIGCFSVSLLLFCTLKNNNFSFLCVWFASICNLFSIQTFVCLKCLFAAYFVFFLFVFVDLVFGLFVVVGVS